MTYFCSGIKLQIDHPDLGFEFWGGRGGSWASCVGSGVAGDGVHTHPECLNSFFCKAHAVEPWERGWVGGGQRAREQARPGPASLPAGLCHL